MGGAKSKLTVKATADVVSNGVLKSTESCLTYMNSDQTINVSGQNNIVSDVTQTVSMTASSDCVGTSVSLASVQASVKADIDQAAQTAIDKATSLVDTSGATVGASVGATVTTNVDEESTKTCLNSLNGKQLVLVAGNNNLVTGVLQEQKSSMVSSCLLQTVQGFNASTDIADYFNQQSDYTSKGPVSDVADAWKSIAKSAIYSFAAIFIFIIVMVIMFEIIHGGKARKERGARKERRPREERRPPLVAEGDMPYGKYVPV